MANKKETVEEVVEEIIAETTEEEIEEEEEAQIDGDANGPIIAEEEEEEEEVAVIEEDTNSDPRKWFIKIWKKNEPQGKDVLAAQLTYSELEGILEIQAIHDGRYTSAINAMFKNAAVIETDEGQVGLITAEPEKWIRNIHLAGVLANNLYATEAVAQYETYET